MATKKNAKKTVAKKKTAKKTAAPKKVTAGTRQRLSFEDGQKIKVIAEHKRREGSRYFEGYEALKKCDTVGAFRKKREEDAQELLRSAQKEGYISVSA